MGGLSVFVFFLVCECDKSSENVTSRGKMGGSDRHDQPWIRVKLRRSQNPAKKWRAEVLTTGKVVEFGQAGASDFTIHKDPARMLRYLIRHGANMPAALRRQTKKGAVVDGASVVRQALKVDTTSSREQWGDGDISSAVESAGFWSRWLTWSFPDLAKAKEHMSARFHILFV